MKVKAVKRQQSSSSEDDVFSKKKKEKAKKDKKEKKKEKKKGCADEEDYSEPKTKAVTDLLEIIKLQNTDGSFGEFKIPQDIKDSLEKSGHAFTSQMLLTLAALKILKTSFKSRKAEWELIANKAKTFLKKNGLSNQEIKQILKN